MKNDRQASMSENQSCRFFEGSLRDARHFQLLP
jgi:hypothetical protein